jgi:hypothetical protein
MNKDEYKPELILKIHRVLDEKNNWMPAIEDVASHDIDPMWVAGVSFLLIDRYVSSIQESDQNKFYEEVMFWFDKMIKTDATQYVEKVNFTKPKD